MYCTIKTTDSLKQENYNKQTKNEQRSKISKSYTQEHKKAFVLHLLFEKNFN